MRKALVLVFVLSVLGVNHVSSQTNNNMNLLATLAIGGVAGWALNRHVERNRRQDAINDYLLQGSFGGGFRDPYYGGRFGGGFGSGFGGAPWYGSRRRGICKLSRYSCENFLIARI